MRCEDGNSLQNRLPVYRGVVDTDFLPVCITTKPERPSRKFHKSRVLSSLTFVVS